MDNTFFVGLTSAVGGTIGLALASCVVIAALVLGATVGYRLYQRFVDWKDERKEHWEGGQSFHK